MKLTNRTDSHPHRRPVLDWILSLTILILLGHPALADGRHYLYLSDQRIVTIELAGPSRAIVNYINLGDSFELFEAPHLVILDQNETAYPGQVIALDEPGDPAHRFKVTELLKPAQYVGLTIEGNFKFVASPAKALLKIGGLILEPEAMSSTQFELLAARIELLDLAVEERKLAILDAGFERGYGKLHFAGSDEAGRLSRLFPEREVLPPVVLDGPSPTLPGSAAHLPDPVIVTVSATVSRAGGVYNVTVVDGINPTLDQMAIEAVRNSWRFLPAVSKKEVAESTARLRVEFKRQ